MPLKKRLTWRQSLPKAAVTSFDKYSASDLTDAMITRTSELIGRHETEMANANEYAIIYASYNMPNPIPTIQPHYHNTSVNDVISRCT